VESLGQARHTTYNKVFSFFVFRCALLAIGLRLTVFMGRLVSGRFSKKLNLLVWMRQLRGCLMGWFEERFEAKNNRLRYDCIVCKKPMWFPQSKHGKYVTCGKVCTETRHKLTFESRARNCETCGKNFVPRKIQISNGNGRFCSQKCNASAHSAMNSKEAQEKARAKWKQTNAKNPIVKSGVEHPRWAGGKEATYERIKQSGKRRIYYNNRMRRNGNKRASPDVVQKLGDLQRWHCAVCLCKLDRYEVDHIIPVAKGGTNENENLQLLCVPCNRKKSHKDPVEFMQSRGFLL
jgi:5-methylcytosine-specific restriction endonuclease McrA